MLQTIAIYVIKSAICAGLLFGYYMLALRNKRFHYYNRFYLLAAIICSAVVPLLQLEWFTFSSSNDNAINLLNVIYARGGTEDNPHAQETFFNMEQLAFFVLFIVTIFMLLMLTYRVSTVYRLKKMYPVNEMDEFSFINTDLQQAPFSFMKNIFWRSDISLEESTGQQILRHELAHIKEKHTWDKLFMQFVLSLFWMNPFYWLIQKELYLIHEFIADEKAVDNKDASAFAAMLLHAKFGQSVFAPAQSFFYSPIKRRLIMLTSSGKTRFSYLRRMMALPLLAATVVLFAFRLQKENPDHSIVRANAPFKLVVDAGHGGTDNGAVGINGLKEKDINLALSKKIKELSAEYGVQVVLTRETDVTMNPAEKVDFSNAQNADAFISVHTNTKAAEDAERKSGVEIFISPDNIAYEKSRILGSALIQSLDKSFTVNKPLMQRKTGIWVLKKNEKPAVLIESGYIDHPGDARLMTDAGQLEKMARTILEGVVLYANQKVAQPYGVELIGASNTDTTLPKPVPLYVLNGKIIDERQMKQIDPNYIESVNVLKDKNATDKYGGKGQNGVIEIITKKTAAVKAETSAAGNNADNSVVISQNGNSFSGQSKVVISERGKDVKGVNDILYVLNGKIIEKKQFDKVNPDEIKSVNVLKDKPATDKYGEKGKNGVIEVVTKSGE